MVCTVPAASVIVEFADSLSPATCKVAVAGDTAW